MPDPVMGELARRRVKLMVPVVGAMLGTARGCPEDAIDERVAELDAGAAGSPLL